MVNETPSDMDITTENNDLSSTSLLSSMSQFTKWMYTPAQVQKCRYKANLLARQTLAQKPPSLEETDSDRVKPQVKIFACRGNLDEIVQNEEQDGPWESHNGHALLNAEEEEELVMFYTSKLLGLIGPLAQVPRLRRDYKVVATAALLFKRFYLSNSVMMFDPKTTMVAAAFLGTKVQDTMADIRHLQEGTKLMQTKVSTQEVIANELSLLTGVDFDLMCIHPYKAILAFTEDLRTFLKSSKGRTLVTFQDETTTEHRFISGQDLLPIHDEARRLMEDVIVSDVPLMATPGQVGLAALYVANQELASQKTTIPKIDFNGYLQHLCQDNTKEFEKLQHGLRQLSGMLQQLKHGKYGCGNHNVDLAKLKQINKKLKKVKVWGTGKKKRKASPTPEKTESSSPPNKKVKVEESKM